MDEGPDGDLIAKLRDRWYNQILMSEEAYWQLLLLGGIQSYIDYIDDIDDNDFIDFFDYMKYMYGI